MFHTYGQCVVGSAILSVGCKLVVMARFNLEQYLSLIQEYKVALLLGLVPFYLINRQCAKIFEFLYQFLKADTDSNFSYN